VRLKGGIHGSPSDLVGGRFIVHDEFVFGGPPGAVGVSDDRTVVGEFGLIAADGMFNKIGWRKIEISAAFTQQLDDVADVHRGSHKISKSKKQKLTSAKRTILAQNGALAKERNHSSQVFILDKRYGKGHTRSHRGK
jgi:hypothetical protein